MHGLHVCSLLVGLSDVMRARTEYTVLQPIAATVLAIVAKRCSENRTVYLPVTRDTPPGHIPLLEVTPRENPPEITTVGRLRSGACLVGRIGSEVRIGASFQISTLRILSHSPGYLQEIVLRIYRVGGNETTVALCIYR